EQVETSSESTQAARTSNGGDDARPQAEPTPAPKPAPSPKPTPATIPPPSALPKPSALAQAAPVAAELPDPAEDPKEVAEAEKFGKVDAEGNVRVVESSGERLVGQYPDVSEKEALALYVRRFLDIKAQVALFETRLGTLSARDLDSGIASLDEALKEPAAVGDLDSLRSKVLDLRGKVEERKQ